MTDIKPFDFRRDWKQFCQLYQKTFGREVNKAYCDWKFLNNPFGEAFGFAAWDNNKLIGFVSVWPLRFCFDGEEIIACSGADTMVDIEYRKQGLFTKLTQILLEEMNKRGWLFRYSAPGIMSYPGYIKKLNHQLIGNLPYRVKLHPARMIYKKLFNNLNKKIDSHFTVVSQSNCQDR
jgi:predicted N-acetyltransferase YhbS